MSRGGSLIDSETCGTIATVAAVGLGVAAVLGLAYQAGADVSERVLRQQRKDKREFKREVRKEQKEKKKEERRKERLEWWRIMRSDKTESNE
jgi:hypothetical protein